MGIVIQNILGALSYVHTHGLIHHDVKPDNVLVSVQWPLVYMLSAKDRRDFTLSDLPIPFTVGKAVILAILGTSC